MPLPMSDVAQAYRSSPEKTEEAVHKVGGRQPGGAGPGTPDAGHSRPLAFCSSRPAWRGTSCGARCPHRPSACSRASSPPLPNRFAGQIAAQGCAPLPQTTLASWCELLQAAQTSLHLSRAEGRAVWRDGSGARQKGYPQGALLAAPMRFMHLQGWDISLLRDPTQALSRLPVHARKRIPAV